MFTTKKERELGCIKSMLSTRLGVLTYTVLFFTKTQEGNIVILILQVRKFNFSEL